MRNLVEHPVTPQEIVECLRRTSRELEPGADGAVGDMDPLLLRMAADVVEAAYGLLEGIDDRLKQHRERGDWLAYTTPWDRATALVRAFQAVRPPPMDRA